MTVFFLGQALSPIFEKCAIDWAKLEAIDNDGKHLIPGEFHDQWAGKLDSYHCEFAQTDPTDFQDTHSLVTTVKYMVFGNNLGQQPDRAGIWRGQLVPRGG